MAGMTDLWTLFNLGIAAGCVGWLIIDLVGRIVTRVAEELGQRDDLNRRGRR